MQTLRVEEAEPEDGQEAEKTVDEQEAETEDGQEAETEDGQEAETEDEQEAEKSEDEQEAEKSEDDDGDMDMVIVDDEEDARKRDICAAAAIIRMSHVYVKGMDSGIVHIYDERSDDSLAADIKKANEYGVKANEYRLKAAKYARLAHAVRIRVMLQQQKRLHDARSDLARERKLRKAHSLECAMLISALQGVTIHS